jgi:hypothetical protein
VRVQRQVLVEVLSNAIDEAVARCDKAERL